MMKIAFVSRDPEARKYFGLKYTGKHEIVLCDGNIPVANVMGCTFRSVRGIDVGIVSMNIGRSDVFNYVQALRQCYPDSRIIVTAPDLKSASFNLLDATEAGVDEILEESYVLDNLEKLIG